MLNVCNAERLVMSSCQRSAVLFCPSGGALSLKEMHGVPSNYVLSVEFVSVILPFRGNYHAPSPKLYQTENNWLLPVPALTLETMFPLLGSLLGLLSCGRQPRRYQPARRDLGFQSEAPVRSRRPFKRLTYPTLRKATYRTARHLKGMAIRLMPSLLIPTVVTHDQSSPRRAAPARGRCRSSPAKPRPEPCGRSPYRAPAAPAWRTERTNRG